MTQRCDMCQTSRPARVVTAEDRERYFQLAPWIKTWCEACQHLVIRTHRKRVRKAA